MTADNNFFDREKDVNRSIRLGETFSPFEEGFDKRIGFRSPKYDLYKGKDCVGVAFSILDADFDNGAIRIPEDIGERISRIKESADSAILEELDFDLFKFEVQIVTKHPQDELEPIYKCTLLIDKIILECSDLIADIDGKALYFEDWETPDGHVHRIVIDRHDLDLIKRIQIKFDESK